MLLRVSDLLQFILNGLPLGEIGAIWVLVQNRLVSFFVVELRFVLLLHRLIVAVEAAVAARVLVFLQVLQSFDQHGPFILLVSLVGEADELTVIFAPGFEHGRVPGVDLIKLVEVGSVYQASHLKYCEYRGDERGLLAPQLRPVDAVEKRVFFDFGRVELAQPRLRVTDQFLDQVLDIEGQFDIP